MSVRNYFNERLTLLWLVVVYGAFSLVHFSHNAIYLRQYPNMPASWKPWEVMIAWSVVAAIGAAGYLVYRRSRLPGLVILTIYAVLGFAGLDHYAIAPVAAHSLSMHVTILGEVATAAILLFFLVIVAISGRWRASV